MYMFKFRTRMIDQLYSRQTFFHAIVVMVLLVCAGLFEVVDPTQRVILKEDAWRYSYPHNPNQTVPTKALPLFIAIPVVAFVATHLILKDHALLMVDFTPFGYAASFGMALDLFVTGLLKYSVGRPRPDFLSRCWPETNGKPPYSDVFEVSSGGVQDLECTGSLAVVLEGRRSFPSGHSSLVFGACGFTICYLFGKFGFRFLNLLSCTLIFSICAFVATSRVTDHWHHWEDVLTGSVIGLAFSWIGYRTFYPGFGESSSGIPSMLQGRQRKSQEDLLEV